MSTGARTGAALGFAIVELAALAAQVDPLVALTRAVVGLLVGGALGALLERAARPLALPSQEDAR